MNENGLLSFLTEIPSFFNVQFPLDYPLLAALYSDVDCRESGSVYFRATKDPRMQEMVRNKVERAGMERGFTPDEVFIATWEDVGHYEKKSDKVRISGKHINQNSFCAKLRKKTVSFLFDTKTLIYFLPSFLFVIRYFFSHPRLVWDSIHNISSHTHIINVFY